MSLDMLLGEEVERLREENARLRNDSERYRWLIEQPGQSALLRFVIESSRTSRTNFSTPEMVLRARSVTEAIDAAIARGKR